MRLIISPAKKMNTDTETLAPVSEPVFLGKTEKILARMRELSYEEAKKLWGCNEQLARQNYERFRVMDLHHNLTPAILSYEGIQYQYMAPAVFEEKMLAWVQKHLRILSGFYGVLRPMDGVTPYRLEMQARLSVETEKDLYSFWGAELYEALYQDETDSPEKVILNLASKEYSRCITQFLSKEDRFITCVFGEWSGEKVVQKGTYAKMARGEMVRFLAEKQADRPEEAKEFDRLGYRFEPEQSSRDTYVFVRKT